MATSWQDALTKPRTIALVGASLEEGSLNYRLMSHCLENDPRCKVYLVNPKWESFKGHKFYKSVRDIEDQIDLAVVMTPTGIVKNVIEDCVKTSVPCINVLTSGFSETGHATGIALQNQILDIARLGGVRILGPNAFGILSLPHKMILDVFPAGIQEGHISIIAQSNGVAHAIVEKLHEYGIGIRYVFSIGNQGDLNISDILDLLVEDSGTSVIGIYMESIKDVSKFTEAARRARKNKKPVVILKAGRTEKGRLAVLSHTASIGGSDESYTAYFRQQGIISVETIREMLGVLMIMNPGLFPEQPSMAAVFNSGGLHALAADVCEKKKISLATFSESEAQEILRFLKENAKDASLFPKIKNPLDVGFFAFDWNIYMKLTQLVSDQESVGAVLCCMFDHGDIARARAASFADLTRQLRAKGKLFVCVWGISFTKDLDILSFLGQNMIPTFSNPEEAITSVKYLLDYSTLIRKDKSAMPQGK